MTREEYEKAVCEKFLNDMVEAGVLCSSHIDEKGRKGYVRADGVTYEDLEEASDDWLTCLADAGLDADSLRKWSEWVGNVINLIWHRCCDRIGNSMKSQRSETTEDADRYQYALELYQRGLEHHRRAIEAGDYEAAREVYEALRGVLSVLEAEFGFRLH
jgi:hypothetical protein